MLAPTMQKFHQSVRVILLVAITLVLAGCINAQTNVALYGNQQWSGVQALQLSAEFTQMLEQAENQANADPNTTMEMDTEGLDEWLDNAQQAANRADVEVTFNESVSENGAKTYVVQATGAGHEALNEILFEGNADITTQDVNGQRQITINYEMSDPTADGSQTAEMTPAEQEMSNQMLQMFGLSFSFRITGGEIISSNATRVENGTAIWENPTRIEVTLTEAAEFSPDSITVVDPPAGQATGFSPQAMQQLMEQMSEGMAAEMGVPMQPATEQAEAEANTAANPAETTTEPATETAPAASDPGAESSEVAATEAPAAELPADEAATADDAATPDQSEANLPQSGAVLPGQSGGLAQLGLAGLVLLALGGAAAVNLRR